MMMTLFIVFAALCVISAVLVVFPPLGPNPVHSAIALISCLFFVACEYVLLHATFIAALQIMVYAGAIMVLFLFVIMLLNLSSGEVGEERFTAAKLIGIGALLFGVAFQLGPVLWAFNPKAAALQTAARGFTVGGLAEMTGEHTHAFGTIQDVGVRLFKDYLVPFEVTSVLLLVAIIGAVILAKRRV